MNPNNIPIVICGSGRSGTTWILDVLAKTNNLRPIYEPLLPEGVPGVKLFANKYVRYDTNESKLAKFMNKVFAGQIDNLWTKYRIRKDSLYVLPNEISSVKNIKMVYYRYKKLIRHYRKYRKINSGRLIIKFIRANLMLGWIAGNFKVKIIYVIRHPGAIACSKLQINKKSGKIVWDFKNDLQRYIQDENLKKDFLYKYADVFKSPLSMVSGFTLTWCIENVIPLLEFKKHDIFKVFYEDLIVDPEKWWNGIVHHLNLKEIPQKEVIEKPSHESPRYLKSGTIGKNQIEKWTKYLSEVQKAEINKILDIFNVNFYDAFNPMPKK